MNGINWTSITGTIKEPDKRQGLGEDIGKALGAGLRMYKKDKLMKAYGGIKKLQMELKQLEQEKVEVDNQIKAILDERQRITSNADEQAQVNGMATEATNQMKGYNGQEIQPVVEPLDVNHVLKSFSDKMGYVNNLNNVGAANMVQGGRR